jgi:hypothetical protein
VFCSPLACVSPPLSRRGNWDWLPAMTLLHMTHVGTRDSTQWSSLTENLNGNLWFLFLGLPPLLPVPGTLPYLDPTGRPKKGILSFGGGALNDLLGCVSCSLYRRQVTNLKKVVHILCCGCLERWKRRPTGHHPLELDGHSL